MANKPRGTLYLGVTSDLDGRVWELNLVKAFNPSWTDLEDKIDSIENVYMPHPNDKAWDYYN